MSGQEIKFLIVEDNELDVENITRSFRRLNVGNSYVRAIDGIEALDVLRGENGHTPIDRPYIILLDINMPRMNGIEFLNELRSDPNLADSLVFVLTTSDRQKDIDDAFAHNICGYLEKPVKVDQMFQSLKALDIFWQLTEATGEHSYS